MYADDGVLIANTEENLQTSLNTIRIFVKLEHEGK